MQKRAVFHHRFLPFVLLAPQIAITVIFFYWPAYQAVCPTVQMQFSYGYKT